MYKVYLDNNVKYEQVRDIFAYLLLLYVGYVHFFRVAISDVDPAPHSLGSVDPKSRI